MPPKQTLAALRIRNAELEAQLAKNQEMNDLGQSSEAQKVTYSWVITLSFWIKTYIRNLKKTSKRKTLIVEDDYDDDDDDGEEDNDDDSRDEPRKKPAKKLKQSEKKPRGRPAGSTNKKKEEEEKVADQIEHRCFLLCHSVLFA